MATLPALGGWSLEDMVGFADDHLIPPADEERGDSAYLQERADHPGVTVRDGGPADHAAARGTKLEATAGGAG
ncbi:hypothetical protein [Nonomuraea candida]|uniref:hypothetical protein n=1 Tax=Nonomuraea candida TaxID=359159 RepID=UPI0005B8BA5D|nr:hypothetical protein [Nonomuraea candida]